MSSLSTVDQFVNEFSRRLVRLHKSSHPQRLFYSLLRALLIRKKVQGIGSDVELWQALYVYFVSAYFRHHTHICGVPATFVTKHNHIVPFYIRQLNTKPLSPTVPILHFDTHSDMNRIEGGEHISPKNASRLVWDIGAAMSGVLTSTSVRNVVWCMPSWVPDDQQTIPYIFNRQKNEFQTTRHIRDVDFTRVSSFPPQYPVAWYTKIRTGSIPVEEGCRKLIRHIQPNRQFILDVDLDYFVCNGQPFRPSYFSDPIDLRSSYRVSNFFPTNDGNPRNRRDPLRAVKTQYKRLDREMQHIDRRIRHFLTLLRCLLRQGYRPCLVSVSDSSNVMGADCGTENVNCNSDSNGYVPTYLALYIHTQVVYGINRLCDEFT